MTDPADGNPGAARPAITGNAFIDEVYRLAAILTDRSHEDADRMIAQKRLAAVQMTDLLRSLDSPRRPGTGQPASEHRWVLDVFDDLAAYADTRGLRRLRRILVDARAEAVQALRAP